MGSFNDILYNIKIRLVLPFQHDLKNILNKVTWNMKATSRQLQKQASPSIVDIKLVFMMCFFYNLIIGPILPIHQCLQKWFRDLFYFV